MLSKISKGLVKSVRANQVCLPYPTQLTLSIKHTPSPFLFVASCLCCHQKFRQF